MNVHRPVGVGYGRRLLRKRRGRVGSSFLHLLVVVCQPAQLDDDIELQGRRPLGVVSAEAHVRGNDVQRPKVRHDHCRERGVPGSNDGDCSAQSTRRIPGGVHRGGAVGVKVVTHSHGKMQGAIYGAEPLQGVNKIGHVLPGTHQGAPLRHEAHIAVRGRHG